MTEREVVGSWIPLMDYAIRNGISLSTLRRYIKSNKIKYRVENGRYLLLDETKSRDQSFIKDKEGIEVPVSDTMNVQPTIQRLERDLRKAHEEIAELKMLIAIYEEKIARQRFDN